MTVVIGLLAVLCLVVGLAVLTANPSRFTNQAFAAGCFMMTVWFLVVAKASSAEQALLDGETVEIGNWNRINAAVIGFWPWTVWLIKESLVARLRRHAIFRSIPALVLGLTLAYLSTAKSFVFKGADGQYIRGSAYVAYVSLSSAAQLLLIFAIARQMKGETGIRRVETQFLALNIGLGGIIGVVIIAIGNMIGTLQLKQIGLLFFAGSYALTGWALTFHRVFNPREVFVPLIARVMVIGAAATMTLGLSQTVEQVVAPPAALFVAISACLPAALLLDRKTRSWFRIDGEHVLTMMRQKIIESARIEASPDNLIYKFERLLLDQCATNFSALLFDRGNSYERGSLSLEKYCPANQALCFISWATPEALQRRRAAAGHSDLRQFLTDNHLGLIITVPRGSPTPSLVVALGKKANEWPYTYPEIERIQNSAELMDNILTRSRLSAQAALEAKTEHLAMMSRGLAHDLKNLLTPVSSFLVHTEGRFPADSAEAEVHAAANRSIRIMGDYVREARFFAEQLSPRFEVTSVRSIFECVREVTKARATPRNVSLSTSFLGDPELVVDRVLIERLLGNLVGNAIDASSAGQTVVLSGEICHGRIRFQVIDHGCGIAAENLGRIFEAYFTTKEFGDEVRGFGLGLTICQKIVQLHRGTILVQSELRQGSTFTVDLPVMPKPAIATVQSTSTS
jgi:signal transduction histidine kinase